MSNAFRPFLIGEAPSRRSDAEAVRQARACGLEEHVAETLRMCALVGESGHFVARVAGLDFPTYCAAFERRNLLDRWPGSNGKGSDFPLQKARFAAVRLLPTLHGQHAVLLGKRVARAFWIEDDYLHWNEHVYRPEGEPAKVVASFHAAILPHPSRINRWWNEPENERRARRFLRQILQIEEVH